MGRAPGARTRYTTVEFSTELTINGQGVRDDREIGPKAPDERRVVVLGDSLVFAVQVPLAGLPFFGRLGTISVHGRARAPVDQYRSLDPNAEAAP